MNFLCMLITALVIGISCLIQMLCIRAKRKILKFLPVVCIIVFAAAFGMEYYKSIQGGGFFGFYIDSILDPLGLVVLWGVFFALLVELVLGVVIAWIVHAVMCVMKKRRNKAADS